MSQLLYANTKTKSFVNLERLFSRSKLLQIALTHKSCNSILISDSEVEADDNAEFAYVFEYGTVVNNERFEFLGDAVLELVVRKALLDKYEYASEGELTRMKIDLVRKNALVRAADRLKLRDIIVTGPVFGEDCIPDSLAANAYEAVIGALFLDSGFEAALSFIKSTLIDFEKVSVFADPKSSLQEYCQAKKLPLPEYKLTKVTGPSHAPIFDINVVINSIVLGFGRASSKKKAQEIAANVALRALERENINGL